MVRSSLNKGRGGVHLNSVYEIMNQQHQTLRRSIPSLHSLTLFEASARHLNFSKAAEELAITQPAVSHGVRQLEAALGQPLFSREGRRLSLTPHGQRLYASVFEGFATISETINEIARTPQRKAVVVATSIVMASEVLIPLLPSLRSAHPDLFVDLRSVNQDPNLTEWGIDAHIRIGDGLWTGYDCFRLWPETIVAVCSPDYVRRRGVVTSLPALLDHDLIHYEDAHRFRPGWTDWLRESGVSLSAMPPISIRVNDAL